MSTLIPRLTPKIGFLENRILEEFTLIYGKTVQNGFNNKIKFNFGFRRYNLPFTL